jgi:hypothetical protein
MIACASACRGSGCRGEEVAMPHDASALATESPSDAGNNEDREIEDASRSVEDQRSSLLQIHREADCTITLDAERPPTDDEVLALLFPELSLDTLSLPERSNDAAEMAAFMVTLCHPVANVMITRPPRVGRPTRIALGSGREAVQVPYGIQAGMVETPLGVLALLHRNGRTVSATALRAASGLHEVPEGSDRGPFALDPIRKGVFGARDAILIESPEAPWGEQFDSRSIVTVLVVNGAQLEDAGDVYVSRRSNDVFWRGPFKWSMKSGGMESVADGYVVHEHWTFVSKKTKEQKTRDVARTYRLTAGRLVATPSNDLSAWVETRADWGPNAPAYDDPE